MSEAEMPGRFVKISESSKKVRFRIPSWLFECSEILKTVQDKNREANREGCSVLRVTPTKLFQLYTEWMHRLSMMRQRMSIAHSDIDARQA
jgi:hypothetical protein